LLLLAATISAGFEGGSIGEVRQLAEHHYECALEGETDQDGRNRQASWYYFRVDGSAGRRIVIDLVGLPGEYNYKPNSGAVSGETPPVLSYDQKEWRHLTRVEYDKAIPRLRLRVTPERSPFWIAHVPPYTGVHLAGLLDDLGSHPHLTREVAGKTLGGRDMLLLTVTDSGVSDEHKKVLWLMVRQHSWESGTSWVGEGALRFLLSQDPEAMRIRGRTIFKIFPMADPDGVARGGVRFNAEGYDLNRNWDAVDPSTMPEIASQRAAILDWVDSGRRIDLFLALHNTETAEYLEGPPEPPRTNHAVLMNRFFALLAESTTFNPTAAARPARASTTPGMRGRMTVNQGLFHDRKIPAFLMEQMISFNSKLGRYPQIEDRLRFGAGLVKAMARAVE
jgi:hypothetical protein